MASRRKGICVVALLALVLAAMPAAAADSDRQVLHVLNRLAFGPTADDFDYVKMIGVDRYIAEQLDPDAIAEPFELRLRLAAFATRDLTTAALRQFYGPPRASGGVKPSLDDIRAAQRRTELAAGEAAQARVLRAVMSRRQLLQVMVNFWFNHFNIFAGEGLERIWIGNYEERAIRPNALGHFRDLLFAVAKHPAMLTYLDNTRNSAASRPGLDRLNENFAREVMELHTLGADGGYTQQDVQTLARVFTGWRVNPPDANEYPEFAAVFEGSRHDYGAKIFLGRRLQSLGKGEGEEALTLLASSPATARHIAGELAQYFVADTPPGALVERLAQRFLATDGDIRDVLRALFDSPEFWASAGQKYKTPYEFVISAVRASGLPANNVRPLLAWMSRLGMPLYGCETPDGYKNTAAAWLSPDAMLERIAFAAAFARGAVPISTGDARSAAHRRGPDAKQIEAMFASSLAPETRAALAAAPAADRAALILGSPDFMRR
jgi:uncharacterized protein (DUF1800 family)